MTQRALFLLAMVLSGLSCGPAFGATYFVNNNGGNDSYTGLAPGFTAGSNGPWQTMGRLAGATLAPGDTVYLACGALWNETLRVPSSGVTSVPITITAGPGNCGAKPPLIDGAVTIPAHQWVRHSGSIYKAKLPIDLIANPNPGSNLSNWAQWSATGDSSIASDGACAGQTQPCMAFTSGTSNSIVSTNNFVLSGGVQYTVGIQLRAPVGVRLKVVLRRAVAPYDRLAPDEWINAAGVWQSVGIVLRAGNTVPSARLDVEVPAGRVKVNVREAHVSRAVPGLGVLATFVDSLQIRRAHHPNFGQLGNAGSPYASIASTGGKSVVDAANLLLPVGAQLSAGLGVTLRTIDWAIEERAAASVNGSKITLSTPTDYDIRPGFGFFLTGALWMLDSPGEWYYEAASTTLYAWMPDGAIPGARISVTGLANGADLSKRANIRLSGVAVQHTGRGIEMTLSSAITISSILVDGAADFGVRAENCGQCSVLGSRIMRTGLDAVSARGASSIGFTLADSQISESGASTRSDGWRMLPRPAYGGFFSDADFSLIARNSIVGTAQNGVRVGHQSVITDNYVSQSCLVLNDCGAIYVGRDGDNATIRGNLIEAVPGNLAGMPGTPQVRTVGIYLDDHNSNSVVTGNTITGAEYGIQMHNANGATVSDNLMFGNRRYQLWLQEQSKTDRPTGDLYGNSVTSNTLVPLTGGPALYLESEISDTSLFGVLSNNQYSALLSTRVIGQLTPLSNRSYTIAEWNASGREVGATAIQPVGYVSFLVGASNLVPNGSLGNGSAGWSWWNATSPKTSAAVASCGFANCITLQAGGSASLLASPNFSVIGGKWYRVAFDAATSLAGQSINAVVRRGGGGTAGFENLMPVAESFAGSTGWRRYSFTFQATKSVTAGDPVTQELGARLDFERNQPGTSIAVARVEVVPLTPAQAPLQIKLLLNRGNTATSADCSSITAAVASCSTFVSMEGGTPIIWPATIAALSGVAVYTRDTTLTDIDQDGIADQQDACPNTAPGSPVNARGCAFAQ